MGVAPQDIGALAEFMDIDDSSVALPSKMEHPNDETAPENQLVLEGIGCTLGFDRLSNDGSQLPDEQGDATPKNTDGVLQSKLGDHTTSEGEDTDSELDGYYQDCRRDRSGGSVYGTWSIEEN